ncbi:pectate lyase family protein [Clostridium sp. Marseille-P299]|uniref:pectate lyase family protein n=1 Tax=Clostridium sp. Marseille-P299 TaxID=1805477 RepID=UPI0009ED10F9|nr:right-handed parallel beta-helix repeat-containing protein [Clostridium sp. Marseille-P299]
MRATKEGLKKVVALLLATSTVFYSQVNVNAASNVTTRSTNEIILNESGGWLESAYVEWTPISTASGYNVYYKAADASNAEFKQLDNDLIRQYSTYCRADVLGLEKGNYIIKVVPIINNSEATSFAISETISVAEQVREGFAFAKQSPMGTGSGGYNDDGTVPSNAQIIYVTADTVNTVQLDVITNSKGSTTTATGLANILTLRQKGYDKTPLIIRIIGKIDGSDITGLNSNGYLQVKGCYNVTIEGVGEDATAYGWGMLLRDAHNVEVRNLGFMLFPDDGISLDTNNENIWVHNNDILYGAAGSDADQVKGDGSCDVKGFSNYVTVSYNHFFDSGKSSLCGMSDSKEFFVTYHHNWFDHSDSRHPRIRVGTIHIYNNYFDGNSKYGVGVTKGSSAFVEANYFRNCKYPMLSSLQGTDIYGGSTGTFSGEAGGMIKAYNNKIEGATRLVYAQEDATQFDAYLATSRNEKVTDTYKTVSGGTTYNNFDTNASVIYDYTPDAPENVEAEVTAYAGRMNGGDFSWTFNNAVDDTSSAVNAELMSAIKSYTSDLKSVGGNSIVVSPEVTPTVAPTVAPTVTVAPTATPEPTTAPTVTVAPTVAPTVTVAPTKAPEVTETPVVSQSAGAKTNLYDIADSEFTNVLYVSPSGTSTATGTYDSPLDLETAIANASTLDGVAIILKEGTYVFDHQITISADNSGTASAYKVLKASKGAKVTLDFSSQAYSNDTSLNARGIQLNANYWYVGGITIYGAADNGMMLSGSHNIIENCVFDSNRDTGLQISRSSSSVTDFNDWPSYNTILNCTSKNNCDPATYENADGFAAKLTCGEGNVFDGCLSYNNSDDGWDLFAKTETGPIGVVTIKNSIAMRNGVTENGTTNANCDGNGFKLGGSGVGTPHIVINCIAIENLHHGFTDNNNPSAIKVINATAFNNNLGGSKNNFSLYRCSNAYVANAISYTTNNTSDKYVNLSGEYLVLYNSSKWYQVTSLQVMNTGSSSSRGEVISTGTTAGDFIDVTIPTVGTDFHKLWRNADGTINTNGVAIVSSSSQFGTFSTDGGVIGARFSSDNKTENIVVSVLSGGNSDNNGGETGGGETGGGETGGGETGGGEIGGGETGGTETFVYEHNFTTDALVSDFYTLKGSLSTSKGTVTYKDLTLTTCLKMESATNISFTTTSDATLKLVFNTGCNLKIAIDGTDYAISNGILEVDLSAGTHSITKKDTNVNLYYISLNNK